MHPLAELFLVPVLPHTINLVSIGFYLALTAIAVCAFIERNDE